jgi:ATP/ADP translocase
VPGITLGLIGIFVGFPHLWTMSLLRIFNKAADYSIYRAAKEILYLPFDYEAKNKAKALIDVWMYRFGKTMAGLTKGGLGLLFVLSDWHLSMLIAFIVMVWLFLTGKLMAAYRIVEKDLTSVSTDSKSI